MKLLEEKANVLVDDQIWKESRSLEQITRLVNRTDVKYGRMLAVQPISQE